jgi:N-acetylmuramoyl-L-alanine amidase
MAYEESDHIYAVVSGGYSRLYLAMAYHETKLGTLFTVDGFDATFKNPVALMQDGEYMDFLLWYQAADEWRRRLVDEAATYKGGIYATTTTLEDLVAVYAPGSAGNNEARYCQVVRERLAAYGYTEGPVAGLRKLKTVQMAGCAKAVLIPEELEFRLQIISAAQTYQRPGRAFTGGSASYYTQHETGNPSYGAGAQMHSNYLRQGAPDNAGNPQELGYHLTLDDKVLCQMLPLDEVAWHAGDSGGPGNFDSIACELCVNVDSNRALSRELAAIVAAGVMSAIGIQQVVQHNHWSGKNCPQIIREIGYWPEYLNLVQRYRQIAPGKPDPIYAAPDLTIFDKLGPYDGTDKVVDGITFFACQRTLTARTTTRRLQYADPGAKSIGPDLKKGDLAPIQYIFQTSKGGSRYALTEWGTRLRASHFTPYVSFTVPKEA